MVTLEWAWEFVPPTPQRQPTVKTPGAECPDCGCEDCTCDQCPDCYNDPCTCGECSECGSTDCCGCDECDEPQCICTCQQDQRTETEVAESVWGLPVRLDLLPIAADFYSLYALYLEGKDEGKLVEFVDKWLPTFKDYTDMVIGGELRHIPDLGRDELRSTDAAPLVDVLVYGLQRHTAWADWKEFRQLHGVDALRWAIEAFKSFPTHGGFGGKPWAMITTLLLRLEEGTISPVFFMDQMWSAEHNGGQYFSKLLWQGRNALRRVLDANLEDNLERVLQYASTDVQEFVKEVAYAVTETN